MSGQPSGTTKQTHVGPTNKSTGEDPEITNRAALLALGPVLGPLVGLTLVLGACGGSQVPAADAPTAPATDSPGPPSAGTTAGNPQATPSAPATPTRPSQATPGAGRHVVLISVDGLNPDAIGLLRRAGRLPVLDRLLREGAGTLNARTSLEETRTLPNHTGMLTGLRVLGPRGTHVTFNDDNGGTLASLNGHYIPGAFDVVHDHGLRTTLLAEKDKFDFLIRSWDDTHGAPDRTGPDNGRDKVDTARIASAATLTTILTAQLAGDAAALSFLHIAAPDAAGHAHGFMSRPYLDAVRRADREIGQVLGAISRRPALRARTTVIVTADHGGRGANHGDAARPDNYRIPFIVWGRSVARGADLYVVNPGRRDPGSARPGYTGPQPIRNIDAAGLALKLLGLPPLPLTQPDRLSALRVR